ncbi:thiamine diphosphokinase [Allofrancisella guangzhouensis]|uniref:Thiamine diphosphokinase n=1 Tax=Allofrancisella guangzhouensis TaxID=594679 RepID=A0A0A8EAP5_9GAMM|nr:thiamine diphosphokinase [Allofrancisella guangzhouensis]AJC49246.1 thiamine pyrophosphokinase [Allofrancisella guangzhouensis]MBK2027688.1 thiamine diphosphokinase [Allofrancisella guangzhouensis]MBK2044898.1 thiamine diphosphokinase [Allofrancisella guangzhouensis]MBK2046423.1 thiamine diphosphokinase [Allofrancisella guangzhouensis]
MSEAILFLNGKIDLLFCQKYIADNYLNFSIFCADGAYLKVKDSHGINKRIEKVIGDSDSYNTVNNDLFLIDNDQYSTDFEKCLDFLLKKHFKKVYVFGASEGEMDHFLGNISVAKSYKQKIAIEFIDIHSRYFFIPQKFIISGVLGKMFSVVPFCLANNIYYNGLRYPLNDESLSLGGMIGTRNYAIEDTVTISYSTGDILLFISHEKYKGKIDAL